MINKSEVLKIIESYIDGIDDNLEHYYNINEEQITKEEAKKIEDLISCKVMQKLILFSVLEEIEAIN